MTKCQNQKNKEFQIDQFEYGEYGVSNFIKKCENKNSFT